MFIASYMDNEEASAKAARERWRKARERAIATETVELRTVSEVSYLCCPAAQAAF
jgi:hypothetical protein